MEKTCKNKKTNQKTALKFSASKTLKKKQQIPIKIIKDNPTRSTKTFSQNLNDFERSFNETGREEKVDSIIKSSVKKPKKASIFFAKPMDLGAKINTLPKKQRIKLLWLSVSFVSLIIFILWSINYSNNLINNRQNGASEIKNDFSFLKTDIQNLYKSLKIPLPNLSDQIKNNLDNNKELKQNNEERQKISEISHQIMEKINEEKNK